MPPTGEIYTNVEDRDISKAPGNLDFYCAGFPCQPFSLSGLWQGVGDAAGRGTVFIQVALYILTCLPRSFLLENVGGLVKNFKTTFAAILHILRGIQDENGNLAYEVHWRLLDNITDGGMCQNRERVYIVGLRCSDVRAPFQWPSPATKVKTLTDILLRNTGVFPPATSKTMLSNILACTLKLAERDEDDADYIVDAGNSSPSMMQGRCPCLTSSHAGGLTYWSTRRTRFLTMEDMLLLQGADFKEFPDWRDVISQRQMGMIVGNSMSQNMMERVMRAMFISLGMRVAGDRWA